MSDVVIVILHKNKVMVLLNSMSTEHIYLSLVNRQLEHVIDNAINCYLIFLV